MDKRHLCLLFISTARVLQHLGGLIPIKNGFLQPVVNTQLYITADRATIP